MYYFMLVLMLISAGLSILSSDKYLKLRAQKELFKSNILFKVSIGSGTVCIILMFLFGCFFME